MAKKAPDILAPSQGIKFFRHAIQFYNVAQELRTSRLHLAMQAIDYSLAISYELALKAIMTARGQFDSNQHHVHDLFKLYTLCEISTDSENELELIDYLHLILKKFGRYPVFSLQDRKLLDSKLKNTVIIRRDKETIERYGKEASETNPESGIINDTYKNVWEKLSTLFNNINRQVSSQNATTA